MEKKQQTTGTLPGNAPAAVNRNTNTDENVERAYENEPSSENINDEVDGDDAAHEALEKEAEERGTDF